MGEFECCQVVFWGTGTKRLGTPGLQKQCMALCGNTSVDVLGQLCFCIKCCIWSTVCGCM